MHVVVYVESTKGMRSGTYKVSKEANVKCGHHELKSSLVFGCPSVAHTKMAKVMCGTRSGVFYTCCMGAATLYGP